MTAPTTTSASTSGTSAPVTGKIVVSSRVWLIWLDENLNMFHFVLKTNAECKIKEKNQQQICLLNNWGTGWTTDQPT